MGDDLERAGLDPSRHRETADEAAFLVREVHDLERMAQADSVLLQALRDLDRAEHADVPVVVAAGGYRVRVRAEEYRGQLRIAPLAPTDDVTCGVDTDGESRVAHELRDVRAPGDIRVAEGEPAHAALGVGAEL